LGEGQRAQIGSARTIGSLSQQELRISVVASSGGAQFGLIGALVDSAVTNSRVKSAEAAVVPVRDALVDYDAAAALGATLKKALAPVVWLKGNSVEVRPVAADPKAVMELVRQIGTNVVLLVQTDYGLSPTFDTMVITARVSLLPRPGSGPAQPSESEDDKAPPPLYFNTVYVTARLPGFVAGHTTLEDAAKLWALNRGQSARRALDGGMDELASLIAFDLEQAGPGDGSSTYHGAAGAAEATVIGKYGSGAATGFIVRKASNRSWVRLRSGELCSSGELSP
jgi:hypothetical protein